MLGSFFCLWLSMLPYQTVIYEVGRISTMDVYNQTSCLTLNFLDCLKKYCICCFADDVSVHIAFQGATDVRSNKLK